MQEAKGVKGDSRPFEAGASKPGRAETHGSARSSLKLEKEEGLATGHR